MCNWCIKYNYTGAVGVCASDVVYNMGLTHVNILHSEKIFQFVFSVHPVGKNIILLMISDYADELTC